VEPSLVTPHAIDVLRSYMAAQTYSIAIHLSSAVAITCKKLHVVTFISAGKKYIEVFDSRIDEE